MKREYAYCIDCAQVIYRVPGYRHGDGQVDTDDNPVWLLGEPLEQTIDIETLPRVHCGCTDH